MKQIILIATMLLTFISIYAQDASSYKKAVINDPDGYTNVREGNSVNYRVITKIYENEVFYAYPTTSSNWYPVITNNGIKGYVHNSRISFIGSNNYNNNLPDNTPNSKSNTESQKLTKEEAEAFMGLLGVAISSKRTCKCCKAKFSTKTNNSEFDGCSNSANVASYEFCSGKCCRNYYNGYCK